MLPNLSGCPTSPPPAPLTWSWLETCSSNFTSWLPGEPNDCCDDGVEDGGENCALIGYHGQTDWIDVGCGMTARCICQIIM